MSFSVIVPCNCAIEGKINRPPFWDKLTMNHGELDIKIEFKDDRELEKEFDSWKFCEHGGIAVEFDMAQSIMGWKDKVQEKYPNQFPNFERFIPEYNMFVSSEYDKELTLLEIDRLDELENYEHKYRFDQFRKLLKTAIELNQEIYW